MRTTGLAPTGKALLAKRFQFRNPILVKTCFPPRLPSRTDSLYPLSPDPFLVRSR